MNERAADFGHTVNWLCNVPCSHACGYVKLSEKRYEWVLLLVFSLPETTNSTHNEIIKNDQIAMLIRNNNGQDLILSWLYGFLTGLNYSSSALDQESCKFFSNQDNRSRIGAQYEEPSLVLFHLPPSSCVHLRSNSWLYPPIAFQSQSQLFGYVTSFSFTFDTLAGTCLQNLRHSSKTHPQPVRKTVFAFNEPLLLLLLRLSLPVMTKLKLNNWFLFLLTLLELLKY